MYLDNFCVWYRLRHRNRIPYFNWGTIFWTIFQEQTKLISMRTTQASIWIRFRCYSMKLCNKFNAPLFLGNIDKKSLREFPFGLVNEWHLLGDELTQNNTAQHIPQCENVCVCAPAVFDIVYYTHTVNRVMVWMAVDPCVNYIST